jgi:RimJ/RimL family protein N-acetyltransferase
MMGVAPSLLSGAWRRAWCDRSKTSAMSRETTGLAVIDWRQELPTLAGRLVTLRELTPHDLGPLIELFSIADASRFSLDEPVSDVDARAFIDRTIRDRSAGLSFTYAVAQNGTRTMVGFVQLRQLEPSFETAECEGTLAPSVRGTGVFLEAARLVGSFVFGTVGARRVEVRVLLKNGRSNGALRKLGAVQEGILRRSVRRRGEYLDQALWSLLKDDWGDHWVSTAPRVH